MITEIQVYLRVYVASRYTNTRTWHSTNKLIRHAREILYTEWQLRCGYIIWQALHTVDKSTSRSHENQYVLARNYTIEPDIWINRSFTWNSKQANTWSYHTLDAQTRNHKGKTITEPLTWESNGKNLDRLCITSYAHGAHIWPTLWRTKRKLILNFSSGCHRPHLGG